VEITREDGLVLSDDPKRIDLDTVVDFLAQSYWASYRTRDMIEQSFVNSRAYGVYAADGAQIAVARAITDLVSFCWIGDVFVDAAWRGRRIGHWLVGGLMDHLSEFGVHRFVLATRDAHGVYADLGFTALADHTKWMEIDNRPISP
jgi:GNAT superfamily N-acetyltransferase